MSEKQYGNAVKIAKDGLAKIEVVNAKRTVIADLMAEIGQLTKEEDIYQVGLKEGFYSSVDLKHFLKLYQLEDKGVIDRAVEYLDKQTEHEKRDYGYIHFLHGDYELIWQVCSKDKSFLGWSSSIKGEMLPLFIALLSGMNPLTPCIREFVKCNCYCTDIEVLANTFKEISQNDYDKYLDWCKKEVDGRVQAVVGGQHRGSYYKASVLVVAMGEALMAHGEKVKAVQFIRSHKEKFPRHRAFLQCMKADLALAGLEG